VLREEAHRWFELSPDSESPYMLLVAPVRESVCSPLPPEHERAWGIERLNLVRSMIPAVTHVDYSARIQTVDRCRNPTLHRLLTKFHERTGCPVLINTSFNVRGEPIVCTPEDAYRCFMATEMDALVMGRQVLLKEDQPRASGRLRQQHLARFQLD
jgi:carbamoyltransferase